MVVVSMYPASRIVVKPGPSYCNKKAKHDKGRRRMRSLNHKLTMETSCLSNIITNRNFLPCQNNF